MRLCASQGLVYYYSKHSDTGLFVLFLYRCFVICGSRINIMLHPLACNLTVRRPPPLSFLLNSIDCAPVGSQTKGLLCKLDCWACAPADGLQQRHNYYWDWGIYRTSGWASSALSPPICLCGFIKEMLNEAGYCEHAHSGAIKINSLNPWHDSAPVSCIIIRPWKKKDKAVSAIYSLECAKQAYRGSIHLILLWCN